MLQRGQMHTPTSARQTTHSNDPHRRDREVFQEGFWQRIVGNRALAAMLKSRLQTKLVVSDRGDIHEKEAERVAEQVMSIDEPTLQRTCTCGGECSECKEKASAHVEAKRTEEHSFTGRFAPPIVADALSSPGQALDPRTRAFMEPRFGYDFGHVRVHTNGQAAASARAIGAKAYTVGHNIVFGAGHLAPETVDGRRLMAHELTHVVQQGAGGHRKSETVLQRAADSEPQFDEEDDLAGAESDVEAEEASSGDESIVDCPEAIDDAESIAEAANAAHSESDIEEELAAASAGNPGTQISPRKRRRQKKQIARKLKKNRRRTGREKRECDAFGKKGQRPSSSLGLSLKFKLKCCTEYDLTDIHEQQLPAAHQPDTFDKETNRDLPALPRGCTYIVRWDVYGVADRVLITDNKTGRVYADNQNADGTVQKGQGQAPPIRGPADVHIRVIPNPIQKPTKYTYTVSKISGRVKATRTCKLGPLTVKRQVSYVPYDPDKNYKTKCPDKKTAK